MRRLVMIAAVGLSLAALTALAAKAALEDHPSVLTTVSATAGSSFDPSPKLDVPVTRITQPMQLVTRQTLDPVSDSYAATVPAQEAYQQVPGEVAGFAGQPLAVYLGSIDGVPNYVFRFNYCLPASGGMGQDVSHSCDYGAVYDAEINADTGVYVMAGQVTNPAPSDTASPQN